MDHVCIEVAQRIDFTNENWKGLIRTVLLGSHIRGSEAISTWRRRVHIDGVRYLKVVTQPLVQGAIRNSYITLKKR